MLENDVIIVAGSFFEEMKETMRLLEGLALFQKRKVKFTHLNHTNGAIRLGSPHYKYLTESGFTVLRQGQKFYL